MYRLHISLKLHVLGSVIMGDNQGFFSKCAR
jgi:hypothetical protein